MRRISYAFLVLVAVSIVGTVMPMSVSAQTVRVEGANTYIDWELPDRWTVYKNVFRFRDQTGQWVEVKDKSLAPCPLCAHGLVSTDSLGIASFAANAWQGRGEPRFPGRQWVEDHLEFNLGWYDDVNGGGDHTKPKHLSNELFKLEPDQYVRIFFYESYVNGEQRFVAVTAFNPTGNDLYAFFFCPNKFVSLSDLQSGTEFLIERMTFGVRGTQVGVAK